MYSTVIRLALLPGLLLVGCHSSHDATNNNPPPPPQGMTFTVSGSVGDGPVTDADVVVRDAAGTSAASSTSDSTAMYQLEVDSGISVPATVEVTGGTDVVTGQAPDIELVSMLLGEGDQTVNVTAIGTLISKAAQCRNDLSTGRLSSLWDALRQDWNFGTAVSLTDPFSVPLTETTIESVVLNNEAFGELIRRAAEATAGLGIDAEAIMDVLACDLADGALDGQLFASSSADDDRILSVVAAASLGVRLEVLAGRLEVHGQNATTAINNAIRLVMSGFANPDVNALPLDQAAIDRLLMTLMVLVGEFSDSELTDVVTTLLSADVATVRSRVDSIYNGAPRQVIFLLPELVALADDTVIQGLATRAQAQLDAAPPSVTFIANPTSVSSGASTTLSWSTTGADICVATGDWSESIDTDGVFQTDPLTQDAQYGLTCVGLGGTTSGSVSVTVGGGSASWPFDTIALSGCSQTRDWVGDGLPNGFEQLTGVDLFTNAAGYGGGSVLAWIEPGSGYMAQFLNATTGNEDAILVQVCIVLNDGTTYDDVVTYLDMLKAEVPGKPVYVMPLDVSTTSSTCSFSGYEESVAFVNQAVSDGIAELGPVIDPLYSQAETRDGCHPNDTGAARMTDTVVGWLESL